MVSGWGFGWSFQFAPECSWKHHAPLLSPNYVSQSVFKQRNDVKKLSCAFLAAISTSYPEIASHPSPHLSTQLLTIFGTNPVCGGKLIILCETWSYLRYQEYIVMLFGAFGRPVCVNHKRNHWDFRARFYHHLQTNNSPFQKMLLACDWALVETELLTIGHQVTMWPELPMMSWMYYYLPNLEEERHTFIMGYTCYWKPIEGYERKKLFPFARLPSPCQYIPSSLTLKPASWGLPSILKTS